MLAFEIVQSGGFSKAAQSRMAEWFGSDIADRLIKYLSDSRSSDLEQDIHRKISEGRAELETAFPSSFSAEIEQLQNAVEKKAKQLRFG